MLGESWARGLTGGREKLAQEGRSWPGKGEADPGREKLTSECHLPLQEVERVIRIEEACLPASVGKGGDPPSTVAGKEVK